MSALFPALQDVVDALVGESAAIAPERRAALQSLSTAVAAAAPRRLTFICTHNSRRSHLAQIWAATAAAHFGVSGVETFSGGTEATAFAPGALATLHRHGFRLEKEAGRDNPRVHVGLGPDLEPLVCFSKVFDQPPNPTADFTAVMTCSHADENCPFVPGAVTRIALPYDDPKAADGTVDEAAAYDRCCRTIGRELLYAFSEAVAR